MHVDHGLAAVELGIDRRERCVAEILAVVACQQADAVGLERVEGVFDFLQAAVGVRRRDRREQAEAAGMIAHELGAVFVDLAAELAGFLVVAPPGAGLDLRQHRRADAALVHVVERHLHRPFRRAGLVLAERLAMLRRQEMVMDVDLGLGALRPHGRGAGGAEAERGDAAGDEFSAAERRAGRRRVPACSRCSWKTSSSHPPSAVAPREPGASEPCAPVGAHSESRSRWLAEAQPCFRRGMSLNATSRSIERISSAVKP